MCVASFEQGVRSPRPPGRTGELRRWPAGRASPRPRETAGTGQRLCSDAWALHRCTTIQDGQLAAVRARRAAVLRQDQKHCVLAGRGHRSGHTSAPPPPTPSVALVVPLCRQLLWTSSRARRQACILNTGCFLGARGYGSPPARAVPTPVLRCAGGGAGPGPARSGACAAGGIAHAAA